MTEERRVRVEEAMAAFKNEFCGEDYFIRTRSPKREGGDREFFIKYNDKLIANIHVKKDNYKIYLRDDLVELSDNKDSYETYHGGLHTHFDTCQQCIEEVKTVISRLS